MKDHSLNKLQLTQNSFDSAFQARSAYQAGIWTTSMQTQQQVCMDQVFIIMGSSLDDNPLRSHRLQGVK